MLNFTMRLFAVSGQMRLSLPLALLVAFASQAFAQGPYPEPPPILAEGTKAVADSIVFDANGNVPHPEQALDRKYAILVFYTVADAIAPSNSTPIIRQLEARRYVQEIQRTDKQVGSPPGASGSTSVLEKPGLMSLLGFAVEHGGVLRESDGTSATLSATPYSLFTLGVEDTAARYDRYDLLRRVEASASMGLDDGDGSSEDLDFKKIEQWSVRVRLYGDRSTRSHTYSEKWNDDIDGVAPLWRDIIAREHAAMFPVYEWPAIQDRAMPLRSELMHLIAESLNASIGDSKEVRSDRIQTIILSNLHQRIYVPFASDPALLTGEQRQKISEVLVADLRFEGTFDQIAARTKKLLEDTANSPLITLGYTNHRVNEGSDYSDVKLLVDIPIPLPGMPAPDLLLNAIASFNHDPEHTATVDQGTVRSYSVAGSLQWAFDDVILGRLLGGPAFKDKIAVAVSGRYERTEDQDDNIWLAQGRIELPITAGVVLPVSVTYANRTELVDEKEVRGNFGITIDTDKLKALARLVAANPQTSALLQTMN